MARAQIDKALELNGFSLPCHVETVDGAIVTVSFDVKTDDTLPQVTIPILWPEYIRLPIQGGSNGTKGVVIPFDAYLGPSCGLGGSTVSMLQPGNLGALGFLPIGNKNWSSVDPQAVTIYGPNGVVLRDQDSNCVVTLSPTGVVIGGTNGDLATTGNLSAGNGITCTFTTPTGQTVTVQNGIVTNLA